MTWTKDQVVLVDTNVIIEAHRTGCWKAIADFFNLETVEKCIEETQTGSQNRSPEENINQDHLRNTLSVTTPITRVQEAKFILKYEQAISLDPGELHLLTHASLRHDDAWLISSPDKAAMRFAYNLGWRDRLISLENMVKRVAGHRKTRFRENYTEAWLVRERTKLVLG